MNDSAESVHSLAVAAGEADARTVDGGSFLDAVAPQNGASAQPSEAETPEAERGPVQLSLFPTVAEPPQLQAPLFHVRCHDCQAINDVPSLPTICYVCRCPLGREHPPF